VHTKFNGISLFGDRTGDSSYLMNNLCTCFVVSKSQWARYNFLTLLLHIINQDLLILITILMFKPKYINSELERTIYQTPSSHLKRSSKSKGEIILTKPKCSRSMGREQGLRQKCSRKLGKHLKTIEDPTLLSRNPPFSMRR